MADLGPACLDNLNVFSSYIKLDKLFVYLCSKLWRHLYSYIRSLLHIHAYLKSMLNFERNTTCYLEYLGGWLDSSEKSNNKLPYNQPLGGYTTVSLTYYS